MCELTYFCKSILYLEDAVMRRLKKQKTGFTLIEIVLVIAIIVILASVLIISVTSYINQANAVSDNVQSKSATFASNNNAINSNFVDLGY